MEFYIIMILQIAILCGILLLYKRLAARKIKADDRTIHPTKGRSKDYLVSLEEAKTMVQLYRNPNRKPKEKDSLTGSYPKGVLKDYINYIYKLSESLRIEVTGIRYYYAVYPDSVPVKGGYQTMVFYPTTTRNGKNAGFDPARSSMDMPFFIDDIFKEPLDHKGNGGPDQQRFDIGTITNIGQGGLNKANTCPPTGDC